jgi:phosphoserine phosphatase
MKTAGFWPSYNLIFFDCDSTLTTVEGIDELARLKGKGWRVSVLTERAMDGELDLEEVYERRLRAISPTREEVQRIAQVYTKNVVPDAQMVIGALQFLERSVFIISGGLADAVSRFGTALGVPPENIRAVELEYDQLSGEWWNFYDHRYSDNPDARYLVHDSGPLTVSRGKPEVVRTLARRQFGRRLLVGDGISDLNTRDEVDLFVGFGGVKHRDRVENEAPVYIKTHSLAPVLPLAVGPAGYRQCLGTVYAEPFRRGLKSIACGEVTFREEGRRQAFLDAFDPLPE